MCETSVHGETHGYSSLETTNKETRASHRTSSSPANRDEDSGSRTLREDTNELEKRKQKQKEKQLLTPISTTLAIYRAGLYIKASTLDLTVGWMDPTTTLRRLCRDELDGRNLPSVVPLLLRGLSCCLFRYQHGDGVVAFRVNLRLDEQMRRT